MKQTVLFIAILASAFLSCKKEADFASIEGKWRLTIVKDNASGSGITKPASVTGEVDITFTSANQGNGFFSGNTPTNEIVQNNYSIGNNRTIAILNLSMTKVAETSWGNEFVSHIRDAQTYSFETDGKLSIKTINKTLTFRRM